ncbi:MAG: zf-HC2 domain-containing protein, partial [Desulfotomaculaceae bacterium]|nr:zf-HC2 domain-containing protein [Desulfotomaculaceae bacterium]
MDCREARLLIMPHLDGALSTSEQAVLKEHVAGCRKCARELALHQRLSGVVREIGQEDLQAPPELCGMVMSKIREQRKSAFPWAPGAWRKAIAAVAAILIFAGGSAGVTIGLKGSDNIAVVEPNTQGQTDHNDISSAAGPDQKTGINDAREDTTETGMEINPGAGIITPDDIPNNEEIIDAVAPSGTSQNSNNPSNTNTAGMAVQDSSSVLLDRQMKVTSTIFKLAVEDLADARARAVSMAAGADAATQVFPEQSGGKKIVVLRLTVASDRTEGLLAGLAKLGTIVEKHDESRDITSFYNSTMIQYNDLLSKISTNTNTEERRQMEAQAT